MTDAIPDAARPGSIRAALAVRDFRLVWTGSFASNVGTWMQNVVLPVYVYARTGRASVVALLILAQLGPILFLAVPGGVLADRTERKRYLIWMQIMQGSCSAALAVGAALDAPIAVLFAAQLGVGVGNLNDALMQRLAQAGNGNAAYIDSMIEARKVCNNMTDTRTKAIAYQSQVKDAFFDQIRYHVDKLELLVDDQYWLLPKYREILFLR